jgi:NitT/TauT family transport system substrate-binding protein
MGRFTEICGVTLLIFTCTAAIAEERVTVRDSWTPSGLQAGWHWGLEKGLFSKNGVTLAYEDGNGSTTTVQLVSTGQIDVGFCDLSVMAVAHGKGVPVVSIGGLIKKTSLGVFVPKDSGIKTPKDLEGKEVLFTATSFEGPFLDTFLRAGGTSREKVNLLSVDAAAKIPNYANGQGQAMITSIPFGYAYIFKARPSNYILFADYGLVLPSYGLVVNDETLKKRGPILRKLAVSFFQAWQQIIDGGEVAYAEAADIIMKRRPDAKLDREQVIVSIREHIKYFQTPDTADKPLGFQSEQDWKATLKSLEDARLVPMGSKSSDYFTNEMFSGLH